MDYSSAKTLLQTKNQEHILRFYEELSPSEQKDLLSQIQAIDWSIVESWDKAEDLSGKNSRIEPIEGLGIADILKNAEKYRKIGNEAIQSGKVAAVLLAGGQGTRLGSDRPKGAYDIGITRTLYIFECLMNNLKAVTAQAGAFVPLFIMTSDKNHDETVAFFKEHGYFGYPDRFVYFFRQEMVPAVDFNGKLLLEEKHKLALSPNGNGGWYLSLLNAGYGEELKRLGVEWLNVFAVDNVLQRIADPVFVGATIDAGADCGAKAVVKATPHEKVGVLCKENGHPSIIEYYELTEEMAQAKNADGKYEYGFGVILNYLFNLSKLNETAGKRMPLHVVKKKVPYVDNVGNLVKPTAENAYKFETLVLDMIRLMDTCLPYEVDRAYEFAPIKNKTGVDSVESARTMLTALGITL